MVVVRSWEKFVPALALLFSCLLQIQQELWFSQLGSVANKQSFELTVLSTSHLWMD